MLFFIDGSTRGAYERRIKSQIRLKGIGSSFCEVFKNTVRCQRPAPFPQYSKGQNHSLNARSI